MNWTLLFIAGIMEIGWAIGLKYTEGFSKPVPSILTGIAIVMSMLLLAKASHTLPIGTAYAVWVGIGAAGTAVLGIFLFQEPANLSRIGFLGLLIVSIIGLKLTSH